MPEARRGAALELAAGLALFVGLLLVFLELSENVMRGESLRFDNAVLRRVSAAPDRLDLPMRLITALGYYWFVLPALAVAAFLFHRSGLGLYAVLLSVSTAGGIILTTALKAGFRRARRSSTRATRPRSTRFRAGTRPSPWASTARSPSASKASGGGSRRSPEPPSRP